MTEDLEAKYYHTLDAEEREILDAYNKDELKSVPNIEEEKRKLVAAARASIAKRASSNTDSETDEVLRYARKFINRYRKALEALAKK